MIDFKRDSYSGAIIINDPLATLAQRVERLEHKLEELYKMLNKDDDKEELDNVPRNN